MFNYAVHAAIYMGVCSLCMHVHSTSGDKAAWIQVKGRRPKTV